MNKNDLQRVAHFLQYKSMNSLDNAIAWISPSTGVKRARARLKISQMGEAKAFYDGATTGRRGDSIRRNNAGANTVSRRTNANLRAGSRDLIRNNGWAAKGQRVLTTETVGKGIKASFLGSEGKSHPELEALAKLHLDTADIDADGRLNYYGLEALVMNEVTEAGEVLVRRKKMRAADGLAVPLQIQILEPDFIDSTKDGVMKNGSKIVQGVEFDRANKRVAYWLFDEHPGDASGGGKLESKRVPASEIIHVYDVHRAGQVRGIPALAPVMLALADYGDGSDAQRMRMKIAACYSVFITGDENNNVENPDVDENDRTESIEPGMINRLPSEADVSFAAPPSVGGFKEYMSITLHEVAGGFGITYEALTGDLKGVNFSSGRMGHLTMRRNISHLQRNVMIIQFCVGVTRWFLEAASLVGTNVEGAQVKHTPPRVEMIDPTREVPAKIRAIRGGLMTLNEAIRESGDNPEEVLREISETNKDLDTLKIILDSDPRKVSAAGLTQSRTDGTNADVWGEGEDSDEDKTPPPEEEDKDDD